MIGLACAGWAVAALAFAWGVILWHERRAGQERLARSCHELRGPLGAIGLGVELAIRTGGVSAGWQGGIRLELARAHQAIEDLQGTASGTGESACGPIDLAALLRDATEAWKAATPRCELSLELPGAVPLYVEGQRGRLAQAVGNLIANAVEHGSGSVRVCARSAGGMARIEVLDQGNGLPASLPRLLRGRHRGRRGHGLRIVAAVAQAHQGRLLSAPSGAGARLVLELPLAATRLPARASV